MHSGGKQAGANVPDSSEESAGAAGAAHPRGDAKPHSHVPECPARRKRRSSTMELTCLMRNRDRNPQCRQNREPWTHTGTAL